MGRREEEEEEERLFVRLIVAATPKAGPAQLAAARRIRACV